MTVWFGSSIQVNLTLLDQSAVSINIFGVGVFGNSQTHTHNHTHWRVITPEALTGVLKIFKKKKRCL